MNGRDFFHSRWCREAASPESRQRLAREFSGWTRRVDHAGLQERCRQLWQFFCSDEIRKREKILLGGVLLYCISPLDLIPDYLPVIGWLDDFAIAGMALRYVFKRMDALEEEAEAVLEAEIVLPSPATAAFAANRPEADPAGTGAGPLEQRLEMLTAAAAELNQPALLDCCRSLQDRWQDPSFKIVFAGRYSTGKSSLINALLQASLLPAGPTPTTRALTTLLHGDTFYAAGSNPAGELYEFQTPETAGQLPELEKLTILTPLLPPGLQLTDTPGLEEPEGNAARLTYESLPEANLIVLLLDGTYLESRREIDFLAGLLREERQRRIFIVINKCDKLPAGELPDLRQRVQTLLLPFGIPAPHIFLLTTRPAGDRAELSGEFQRFRRQLEHCFQREAQSAKWRQQQEQLDLLAGEVIAACRAAIQAAAVDEQQKNRLLAEIDANRRSLQDSLDGQQERLHRQLRVRQLRFEGDLAAFINTLNNQLSEQIAGLSLAELQSTSLLAEWCRNRCRSFLEETFTAIHREVAGDLELAAEQLQSDIKAFQFSFQLEHPAPPVWPKLLLPAILAGAWFSCGLAHFLWIALGALFGRKLLSETIQSLLASGNVRQARQQLNRQLADNLKQFEQQCKARAGEHFERLETAANEALIQPLAETFAHLDSVRAAAARNTPAPYRKCLALLQQFEPAAGEVHHV